MNVSDIVWRPSQDLMASCAWTRFADHLRTHGLTAAHSPQDLHAWAVQAPELFWPELVRFVGIKGDGSLSPMYADSSGPTPLARQWFPSYRLNFAENLLAGDPQRVAVISWSENQRRRELALYELREQAEHVATYLASIGIGAGERVFAYLPNVPEALACMLGCATLGATWSSCGTDYHLEGIVSRLNRVKPRVFIATTSYLWRGGCVDVTKTVAEILARAPSVQHLILVDCVEGGGTGGGSVPSRCSLVTYADIQASQSSAVKYERFSFNHPLYVMFSSGTTGQPKGIVHGAGGTLLEHKKEMILHSDVRAGDRVFYQTSTSWMMWNWCASALACDATVVMYDGDPLLEGGDILWRLASQEQVSHFGTSAAFLGAVEKQGLVPGRMHSLDRLRTILSTGSTLYPSQFDYIAHAIKPVWVQSISGGTDIIGCFGLGCPVKPVVRGETQAKSLGYDVCVFDPEGHRILNEQGELVCAKPAPSMPIYFLDDPDGSSYRAAYFDDFPGVWRHGDFLKETSDGGLLFLGRSDATLKPAGVRVATADLYAALAPISRVQHSLAVGFTPVGATSERIVLFVALAEGDTLDSTLESEIKQTLKASNAFYVPALIVQAPEIPRTTNNKISELSVKRLLRGEEPGNASALANPESLAFFAGEGREIVTRNVKP
jgi:acetoacetyl-CoA synthetase